MVWKKHVLAFTLPCWWSSCDWEELASWWELVNDQTVRKLSKNNNKIKNEIRQFISTDRYTERDWSSLRLHL